MSNLEHNWFSNINRPSRYLGNEINSIKKDPSCVEVSIALAFPDTYEVGMSHLGLKILYHILNAHSWLAAERAFSPLADLEQELRHRDIPLASLESNRPLSDFDIIGFSLQHELSYTNVLNILDLSGIPFLASERGEDDPLIIAGGPACFNPEPVAEIFDVMVVGDGEAAALGICRAVRETKQNKLRAKRKLFSRLCHIKGAYIPSFFHVGYNSGGTVDTIKPLVPDYRFVEKAILPDIDDYPYPDCQVVPFAELVHDRVSVEIARGCTRGCRFCQAGMVYRPVRERSPLSVLEKVERTLKLTGYEDLSLLSLSSGDYSCIESLLTVLMDRQSSERVAISLPSLRIDSLNTLLIEQIKRVRKTGFTLAPEAGNDRLRRVINKGLTQEDILETARAVYGAGWNLIKLYFMVGLPSEDHRDLQDIVDLANQITGIHKKRGKRANLNLSISTFVPKSHTPFMWQPQIPLEESRRRIQFVRDGLKGSSVKVKWNQPELSWLEGVFSRGDRRLNQVIIEAWRLGAKFDAWGDHFRMDIWERAFDRTGIDPSFYLYRERTMDEVLPWSHIKSGITEGFLKREWQRALREKPTPDCREKCLDCGVCDHKTIGPIFFASRNDTLRPEEPFPEARPAALGKYRLTFTKLYRARHLGHLELVRVFVRALRRAGLKLAYSKGFHPMPKVSFACALPVGTESMEESVDIQVVGSTNTSLLKEKINRQLPPGIHVTLVENIPTSRAKIRLKQSDYLVAVNGVDLEERDLERFLESDSFVVTKVNKKGKHVINARPLVKSARLVSPNGVKLILKHTEGPALKPIEIVKSIFSLVDIPTNDFKITKTGQVLE